MGLVLFVDLRRIVGRCFVDWGGFLYYLWDFE